MDARSIAERVAEYDWDGGITAGAREVADLIAPVRHELARCFWDFYLALPDMARELLLTLATTVGTVLQREHHAAAAEHARAA